MIVGFMFLILAAVVLIVMCITIIIETGIDLAKALSPESRQVITYFIGR
jgi:hypothetical protein